MPKPDKGGGGGGGGKPDKGGGGGGKPDKGGGGGGKKPPKTPAPGVSVPDPSRETLQPGRSVSKDADDATGFSKKFKARGEGAIRQGLNVPQPSSNGLNFPGGF